MPGLQARAVVFDFDGVLVDTETAWCEVRREVTLAGGGSWYDGANSEMQGLSTGEWAGFMRNELGVGWPAEEVIARVISELERRLGADPPFLPGVQATVTRLAREGCTLGVASSSPRRLLDTVLGTGGIGACFAAIVSSEEVARGKPYPDVYLAAAEKLSVPADLCLAVEDSGNGLRAADAAGMTAWAVPNVHDPPDPDALALARRSAASVGELFAGVACPPPLG